MKNIKVLGIDLAKDVFQLHGTDAKGKQVLKKRFSRGKLIEFVANLTPCLIGIEACLGAHYWARTFEKMGHTVKIMAPKFVKPYVKSNKNDANDAAGIASLFPVVSLFRRVAIDTTASSSIKASVISFLR